MKKISKRRALSVLFLVSFMAMAFGVSGASAADSSILGIKVGQRSEWVVTDSSGVTSTWYSETFMARGNFSVPVGSMISFTLTGVTGGRFIGDISAGDLSLVNVSMSEIAFNLLLGWWPFQPGLVCPINWDVQKQNATSNGFSVTESMAGFGDRITFKHLNGTTGTMLVYNEATGLLTKGYGSFGQFLIEVTLTPTMMPATPAEAVFVIAVAGFSIAAAFITGWISSARERQSSRHS
jgi:hypothetical protein